MPEAGRVGDASRVDADSHGCPACPHTASGAAISGSPDVLINQRSALRVGDQGVHAACCGPNKWTAKLGSATVLFNDRPAHRKGDAVSHCGGTGALMVGSGDVLIGDGVGTPLFGGGLQGLLLSDLMIGKALDHDAVAASISNLRGGVGASVASLSHALSLIQAALHLEWVADLVDLVFRIATRILKIILWPLRTWIPEFDKLLRSLLAYLKQLAIGLLNMFDLDGNECPQPMSASTLGSDDEVTFNEDTGEKAWDSCNIGEDVSVIAYRLLDRYRPIFIELHDDILPMDMADLLPYAHLDPPPAGRPNGRFSSLKEYADAIGNYAGGALVIDEQLARGHIRTGARTYHARAVKIGDDELAFLYFALRPGSFFSNKYLDQDLYEHQGDGEGINFTVRRYGQGEPWRLMGINFPADHYKQDCFSSASTPPRRGEPHDLPLEMRGERPVIYVAIGSHPMCPRGGKRRNMGSDGIKGWFQRGGIDFYPAATTANTFGTYELRLSTDPNVEKALFTKGKITWGQGAYVYGPNPYPGYDPVPVAEGVSQYDARLDEAKFWRA